MDCGEWCLCICLSYYLGCGTLFACTICHEKYEEYKKIMTSLEELGYKKEQFEFVQHD